MRASFPGVFVGSLSLALLLAGCASERPLLERETRGGAVRVAWTADGTTLLARDQSGCLHAWNAAGERVVTLEPGVRFTKDAADGPETMHPTVARDPAPDENVLAYGGRGLRSFAVAGDFVWFTEPRNMYPLMKVTWPAGKVVRAFRPRSWRGYSLETFELSPDGGTLLGGFSDGFVRLVDVQGERPRDLVTLDWRRLSAAQVETLERLDAESKDARARGDEAEDFQVGVRRSEVAGDVSIGGVKQRYRIESVAISPDGKRVAAGGTEGQVVVWTREGERLSRLSHPDVVHAVAFVQDFLATACEDGKLRLWLCTGELRLQIAFGTPFTTIAVSPDGTRLAVGAADGTVHLLRIQITRISGNGPEGQDQPLLVPERTIEAHEGGVRSVAFSPDGKRIVSGGEDGRVRVWPTMPPP